MKIDTKQWIIQSELARKYGTSPQYIRILIDRGKLKSLHVKEWGITLVENRVKGTWEGAKES